MRLQTRNRHAATHISDGWKSPSRLHVYLATVIRASLTDIGMESPLVQVGRSASPSDDSITARIEAAFVGRIGAARFSLWFPPNARLLWFGHELVVASRNSHFQEWADDKFGPALREAVAEVCGEGVGTRFVSDPDLFADPKPAKAASPTDRKSVV